LGLERDNSDIKKENNMKHTIKKQIEQLEKDIEIAQEELTIFEIISLRIKLLELKLKDNKC
jgi:hypothetical protein